MGQNWQRTLERIEKRDGPEAAAEAARVGGVAGPAPGAASPAGDGEMPEAIRRMLLAIGLSLDSDPVVAAGLVGLPVTADLLELAAAVADHPIAKGDSRAAADLIRAAALTTTAMTMRFGAAGDAVPTARMATASRQLWASYEAVTGGAKPMPSDITIVFEGPEA